MFFFIFFALFWCFVGVLSVCCPTCCFGSVWFVSILILDSFHRFLGHGCSVFACFPACPCVETIVSCCKGSWLHEYRQGLCDVARVFQHQVSIDLMWQFLWCCLFLRWSWSDFGGALLVFVVEIRCCVYVYSSYRALHSRTSRRRTWAIQWRLLVIGRLCRAHLVWHFVLFSYMEWAYPTAWLADCCRVVRMRTKGAIG